MNRKKMNKNIKTKNMNKNEKQNRKKRYVQAKISSSGSLSDFG